MKGTVDVEVTPSATRHQVRPLVQQVVVKGPNGPQNSETMKKFVGIALSMVLAGALHAQGFGPGGFPGFPPPEPGLGGGLPLQELDLTPAQEQQIKQILGANQSALRSAELAVLKAQKTLEDTVAADPSDQTAIGADAAALGSALGQLAVARAGVESQVSAILTTDQKQKLAQERQRSGDRLNRLIERLSASN
jgi:Spy/CpxP family protein refolding chaperone